MMKYFNYRENNLKQGKEEYVEMPLAQEMKDAGYDAKIFALPFLMHQEF